MNKMQFKEWLVLNERNYGTYCGPGPKLDKTCSKLADGSPMPHPMNSVDAACQSHDIKYCKCDANWRDGFIGYSGTPCSRNADAGLVDRLKELYDKLAGREKLAANIITKYFRYHVMMQQALDRKNNK